MESKLKALKVVDLKDILAKANVPVTGKANKPDLIAKILASPEAIDLYNQTHGPAPPASSQDASSASQPVAEPPQPPQPAASQPAKAAAAPPASKPTPQAAPKPTDASSNTLEVSSAPAKAEAPAEDEEAAKRKARAARFGIPVVDPKAKPAAAQKNGKAAANGKIAKAAATAEDADKIAARAARFGAQAPTAQTQAQPAKANGKKRAAPPADPVDEEELARRKKRAERFGIPLVGA